MRSRSLALLTCLGLVGASRAFGRPPGELRWLLAGALLLGLAAFTRSHRAARLAPSRAATGELLLALALVLSLALVALLAVQLSGAEEVWDVARSA